LFSSPHISSFRERIKVNGRPIPEAAVEALLPPIVECCAKHDIPATFFELTTVLSLAYFNSQRVDHAVYEVAASLFFRAIFLFVCLFAADLKRELLHHDSTPSADFFSNICACYVFGVPHRLG
jgi:hypothetical protein